MKASMNIRSIIMVMAIIGLASMFFINICFAANTGKITTETARLREKPNTESKILELASEGEEVEILEEVDNWYKVKYKKITGYIRNDLIQINKKEHNNKTEIETPITTETPNGSEMNTTNNAEKNENSEKTNTVVETNTSVVEEKKIEKGKYKIAENVKLKIIPLISAIELDEISKDVEVEVIEILNNWAKVRTQEGKEGWIRIEKLSPIEEKKENSNNQQASTKSVEQQNKVTEQKSTNTKKASETTSRSATTRNTEATNSNSKSTNVATANVQSSGKTSATGTSIVSYAKQFLGCKYVYGGTTTKGFDCSGFTQFVYKHFGVNLNRTAAAQYSNGKSVTSLQSGDLVMFGKSGINHVGIYIGGNTFIHAANPSRGVTTDTLSSGYYKTNYVGARRII